MCVNNFTKAASSQPWRGLVCHGVTYLAYSTACRVVYAVFLACIDDICVSFKKIIISNRELYFKSYAYYSREN